MSGVAAKRALVITVSTRASAGVWEDRSGPVLRDGLIAMGLDVDGPVVVADGDAVETALRAAVASAYDLVVTTGGTGLTPTDLRDRDGDAVCVDIQTDESYDFHGWTCLPLWLCAVGYPSAE